MLTSSSPLLLLLLSTILVAASPVSSTNNYNDIKSGARRQEGKLSKRQTGGTGTGNPSRLPMILSRTTPHQMRRMFVQEQMLAASESGSGSVAMSKTNNLAAVAVAASSSSSSAHSAAVAAAAPVVKAAAATPLKYAYFPQNVDHFNSSNTNTWQQRYLVDDQYYIPGGPVFLYLAGENSISPLPTRKELSYNLDQTLAKRFNGLWVTVEHRYYGASKPVSTPLGQVESLRYLTMEQALADFANFASTFTYNGTLAPNFGGNGHNSKASGANNGTKWIVVGGSYAGALSAFARHTYPNVFFASHASSAPVSATTDFWQYQQGVQTGLQYSGGTDACTQGWMRLVQAFDAEVAKNQSAVKADYGAYPAINVGDIGAYWSSLAATVQYGYPYANFEGTITFDQQLPYVNLPADNIAYIDAACDSQSRYFPYILNTTATHEDLYQTGIILINLIAGIAGPDGGMDWTGSDVSIYAQQIRDGEASQYLWGELGYLQTGGPLQPRAQTGFGRDGEPSAQPGFGRDGDPTAQSGNMSMFSRTVDLNYWLNFCSLLFAPTPVSSNSSSTSQSVRQVIPKSNMVNRIYSTPTIAQITTNIVWVNGQVDPWNSLSITSQDDLNSRNGQSSFVIVGMVNNSTQLAAHHCADLTVPQGAYIDGDEGWRVHKAILAAWDAILLPFNSSSVDLSGTQGSRTQWNSTSSGRDSWGV